MQCINLVCKVLHIKFTCMFRGCMYAYNFLYLRSSIHLDLKAMTTFYQKQILDLEVHHYCYLKILFSMMKEAVKYMYVC